MSVDQINNQDINSLRDFYPTENYNVIAVSDDHIFDTKDLEQKATRIREETELIDQAADTFNASELYHLGDGASASNMARLLNGLNNIDEATILEGDEDRKRGDHTRDAGWAAQRQEIGELIDNGPRVRTGEEFVVDVFPDYEIMLDHYPGRPEKNRKRNFQYDWFADDLFYQGTQNSYPKAFREPKVALTGHVHAPYSRSIASSIAVNVGALEINSNTSDALPERNFYALSFAEQEVQTAMIDADTREILEYDVFQLKNGQFIHEISYSESQAHHPEQRFTKDIIDDKYGSSLIDTTERMFPRETAEITPAD